eukprot:5437239-Amphidinium_carterae.2
MSSTLRVCREFQAAFVPWRDRILTSLCGRREEADGSGPGKELMAGVDAQWLLVPGAATLHEVLAFSDCTIVEHYRECA